MSQPAAFDFSLFVRILYLYFPDLIVLRILLFERNPVA